MDHVEVIILRYDEKEETTKYFSRMRFIVLVKIVINIIDLLDRMTIVHNKKSTHSGLNKRENSHSSVFPEPVHLFLLLSSVVLSSQNFLMKNITLINFSMHVYGKIPPSEKIIINPQYSLTLSPRLVLKWHAC